MSNTRIGLLFTSNLVIFTAGNGLLPIWPLYVRQLGASEIQTGIYLALAFLMLAIGTLSAGFWASKIRVRTLFLLAAVANGPVFWLAGEANSPEMLTLITSVAWFLGGIETTLLHITTGRFADQNKRGRSFSWLYLALPLGAILGGVTLGRLADGSGFPAMFHWLGLGYMILVPLGYLALRHLPQAAPAPTRPENEESGYSLAFKILLSMALLFNITIFAGRLGTSLRMEALDFSASAVSGAAAFSGLVAIPFILVSGQLSDRLGRHWPLAISFLITAAGMLILGSATLLFQFWLAAAFLSIASYSVGPVLSALATDLLPSQAINRGLALLNTMVWLAGIIGFAIGGTLIAALGAGPSMQMGAYLAVGALVLLVLLAIYLRHVRFFRAIIMDPDISVVE